MQLRRNNCHIRATVILVAASGRAMLWCWWTSKTGRACLSRLVGPDRRQAAIGQRLEASFVEVEKQKLPYFRIAGGVIVPGFL